MFTVARGLTDCEMGSSSMPNVSHVDPSLAWQWLSKDVFTWTEARFK